MKISRTFTYKLKISKKEASELDTILAKTTFCYNLYLYYIKNHYDAHQKLIPLKQMLQQLPIFQKKHTKLQNINIVYLNSCVVNMFYTLSNANLRHSFPTYEKDADKIILLRGFSINQHENHLSIPDLNPITYGNSRPFTGHVSAVQLIKKIDGWFMHIILSQEIQPPPQKKEMAFLGIDVGLKDFAILSNGTKVPNPRFYRTMEEKLKKEQKSLARKERNSSNWSKQLYKVQKVHKKIYHSRMNFLHQLTTYLTNEYDVIGIEKLSIAEMKQNRRLSKSIQDASWGLFVKLLKYKATERGKHIVEVSRYFPSTKTCSKCGNKEIIPLHLRTFKCSKCHFRIHRDYNAAMNIELEAKRLFGQ